MRGVEGNDRTVLELLDKKKYGIDYYQREYKWQTKQMVELIDDLTSRFMEDYRPEHSRKQVAKYGHYFLGSIILSEKGEIRLIVDGQQRLTSLTLLLMYLNNLQQGREVQSPIENLIYSDEYGNKSFNLHIPERTSCMEALYKGIAQNSVDQSESVQNLVGRYQDIEEQFPEELREDALPYFIDWLTHQVQFVEIIAYEEEEAYTIFETMNDRGLSLSPTEMLRGYLLANIEDDAQRADANNEIKKWLLRFAEHGKDTEAGFFKVWLRAQYAQKIRERSKGALPEDHEKIGTEFNRWVRDKKELLGLTSSDAYYQWVMQDMRFFAHQYLILLQASSELIPGLEAVRYTADNGFTLQYQLLLAPLTPEDDDAMVKRKLQLVATYLDCWLNRRLWNSKLISYSGQYFGIFLLTREIRRMNEEPLRNVLVKRLADEAKELKFSSQPSLYNWTSKSLHRQLARFIDYIETQSGQPGRYAEYLVRSGKYAYEIEHIWANQPERHEDEFDHQEEFFEYRNRMGGLLLLPKKFNASFGKLSYEKKLPHYNGQNLLARSLHPECYNHNPGFRQMMERTGLKFQSHGQFKKADFDMRFALYRNIAERLWSAERLQEG